MFISIGMGLFILGIYFIGEGQQLFTRTFRINAVFRDVAGLQPGNNVRLSGVNVGTVDNIRIESDSSIRVELLIEEKVRMFIKKDAMATIGSEGLMGNKLLMITPGTGGRPRIQDNDTVGTLLPISVDEVFISLKTVIDNTANITANMAKVTERIQSGKGAVGKLLMDSSSAMDFDTTLMNLKSGSNGFRTLMEKANHLDAAVRTLQVSLDNTAAITHDLSTITASVSAGKGTLGRILMDSTLGLNIDTTIIHLKDGSAGVEPLMKKAKTSWLLWGW